MGGTHNDHHGGAPHPFNNASELVAGGSWCLANHLCLNLTNLCLQLPMRFDSLVWYLPNVVRCLDADQLLQTISLVKFTLQQHDLILIYHDIGTFMATSEL